MPTMSAESSANAFPLYRSGQKAFARLAVALSGFFFVVLQSVCTFFIALSGVRLLIGVGSLAAITKAGAYWDRFHTDSIRLPMMAFALAAALVNIVGLLRQWRLRNRAASQWRRKPVSPRKLAMERVEFALAVATLVLFCCEELGHLRTFHHF